ncbi:protein YIF1B [Frankliniella occidentalis]|uniref:Protein YIF1 n=1 Tax=Frankliniella occidentalis TaxID=133901 RepID=A0A6J1S5M2_FRAOC|nr:protein YIF1B [Frankliniella occidentalis]
MNFNSTGGRHPAQRNSRKLKAGGDAAPASPMAPYPAPYNPSYPSYAPPPYGQPGADMYAQQHVSMPGGGEYMQPMQPQNMGGFPGGPQMNQGFAIPSQVFSQPIVADLAMQYGASMVGAGRQIVDRELEKYVPVSRLKYYFAVDTKYVANKLRLLFFPFTHSDWSMKYEQGQPVQPRFELNAPDLYIPTMAYVTYVLLAGFVLGFQNRFTPEKLGIQASSALAWAIAEVLLELITLYVTNINTNLTTLDLVAYSGYKYVGMIFAVLLSLAFSKTGYYLGLLYFSLSLAFYLIRTLKCQVLPESEVQQPSHDMYGNPIMSGPQHTSGGNKRRTYILLFVAGIQPVLMWWLSYHLVSLPVV